MPTRSAYSTDCDRNALWRKTFKRIKDNEAYLSVLVDRLIDRFIAKGYCNIVPEFGPATSTYAISDLMGIPEADRAELLELIGAPPSQVEGDAAHKVGPDPLIFLKQRFDQYLRDRQTNPGSDLMSELVNARLKDASAADFEILSGLARFLFGAGQDTTSRLIAMAIQILADDAALQQRLRKEPERIPDFFEEVLRYDAPVKAIYRLARKRTTTGGVDVPAGTILTLCKTRDSREPARFHRFRGCSHATDSCTAPGVTAALRRTTYGTHRSSAYPCSRCRHDWRLDRSARESRWVCRWRKPP